MGVGGVEERAGEIRSRGSEEGVIGQQGEERLFEGKVNGAMELGQLERRKGGKREGFETVRLAASLAVLGQVSKDVRLARHRPLGAAQQEGGERGGARASFQWTKHAHLTTRHCQCQSPTHLQLEEHPHSALLPGKVREGVGRAQPRPARGRGRGRGGR